MSYALQRGEPLSGGVTRIAEELLAPAAQALRGGADPTIAVHEARKATKRLRALVRLARRGLGKQTARGADRAARDAARLLAGARDAAILPSTLEALVAGANDPGLYADLRSSVVVDAAPVDREAMDQAADALDALRQQAAGWELRRAGWDVLGDGLEQIYGGGAKAMRRAAAKPRSESLHEWRKSVKHLWHALELLTPAWPVVLGPLADEIHRLSALLGDDHDLDVLCAHLDGLPVASRPEGLNELVATRHAALRAAAFSAGLRIYAEDADEFTNRIAAYHAAWSAG